MHRVPWLNLHTWRVSQFIIKMTGARNELRPKSRRSPGGIEAKPPTGRKSSSTPVKIKNHKLAVVATRRRVLAHRRLVRTTFVSRRDSVAHFTAQCSQVLMIFRPAGRFLTIPFPPGPFAARRLAAVILPPRLFFAIMNPFGCCVCRMHLCQFTLRPSSRCLF